MNSDHTIALRIATAAALVSSAGMPLLWYARAHGWV